MIDLSNIKKIYVYQKKVDLRYGINKLSILAQELVALSNMKHTLFSILRSGYFYLDSYHEEHPRVFTTNIRYRIMSLAWMETYGVS